MRRSWALLFLAVLAVLSVGCRVESYVVRGTESVAQIQRVTSQRDNEVQPCVDPMGERVAFVAYTRAADQRSNYEIWTLDTQTQRGRSRVTSHQANDTHPCWNPDGTRVLFDAERTAGQHVIWERSASGIGGTRLVVGMPDMMLYQPHASEDGRVAMTAAGNVLGLRVFLSGKVIETYRVSHLVTSENDGSNFTILGKGGSPKWSPDGRELAFTGVSGEGKFCIWTMGEDGGNPTQLTPGERHNDVEPCWSPDGKWIAFSSDRGTTWWDRLWGLKSYNLWVMKADGSNLMQLTDHTNEVGYPSWGADDFIYFHTYGSGFSFFSIDNWDIWRLKPLLIEAER